MSEESSFTSIGQVVPSIAPNKVISEDDLNKLEAIYSVLSEQELRKHEITLGLSHKGEISTRIHSILLAYLRKTERFNQNVYEVIESLKPLTEQSISDDWKFSRNGIIQRLTLIIVNQVYLKLSSLCPKRLTIDDIPM